MKILLVLMILVGGCSYHCHEGDVIGEVFFDTLTGCLFYTGKEEPE